MALFCPDPKVKVAFELTERVGKGPVHRNRLEQPDAKRPRVTDKAMDGLLRMAWEQGWWCVRGKKHVKCYPPNDGSTVPIPGTPGDHRSFQNTRKQMERSGLVIYTVEADSPKELYSKASFVAELIEDTANAFHLRDSQTSPAELVEA